ncbi:MBL fold metallo-hydrolase [Methylophaga sp.]|uniref:MBL fold metallo-hydrolase n=1 Tax=Methylophaga sp. TaxID=2024840 RepID=UPI003F6A097C
MKQVLADVWETRVEQPFPGLTTHAYLVTRDMGNILFYNTRRQADIDQMRPIGGVRYHFLSHRDEVADSVNQIRKQYGATLGAHINEKSDFAKVCSPDISFSEREWILENVEIIPTPGHTLGSTCFLVESGHERTYLFTGDTLYLTEQGWQPGLLSFSDRDALIESLKVLQTLTPDVVFSSAFSGSSGYQKVTGKWHDKVQTALDKLET